MEQLNIIGGRGICRYCKQYDNNIAYHESVCFSIKLQFFIEEEFKKRTVTPAAAEEIQNNFSFYDAVKVEATYSNEFDSCVI